MARDPNKEFIRIFDSIGRYHSRYERFADFLELATCAIRKTTVPPGPGADAFEERYMKVVARYPPDDIRTMPKLLALTQLAVAQGGCDFLGTIAGGLQLLDARLGQLITPYPLSRLIPETTGLCCPHRRARIHHDAGAGEWCRRHDHRCPPMSWRPRGSILDPRSMSKPSMWRHSVSR
jgi:hypothetical protein